MTVNLLGRNDGRSKPDTETPTMSPIITNPFLPTFASPTAPVVRYLRPYDGREKCSHECLPPKASLASTVRVGTRQDGGDFFFSCIDGNVYEWSPIQGAWIREL